MMNDTALAAVRFRSRELRARLESGSEGEIAASRDRL